MELLGEFMEKVSVGRSSSEDVVYSVRKAARSVVFDQEGRIALLFVAAGNYHKLPGGGVERGESVEEALQRETREEIGSEVKVDRSVGASIEYRDQAGECQISYCYLAELVTSANEPAFTEEELKRGFRLDWVSLEEAIATMEQDKPRDVIGNFIQGRDLLFLKKARLILNKKD